MHKTDKDKGEDKNPAASDPVSYRVPGVKICVLQAVTLDFGLSAIRIDDLRKQQQFPCPLQMQRYSRSHGGSVVPQDPVH